MFKAKVPKHHERMLEEELVRAVEHLRSALTDSEEYSKMLTTVERLHSLLEEEKPDSVSKNTLANIGANLLGILMIIKHESVGNFISSKALGFVHRIKI